MSYRQHKRKYRRLWIVIIAALCFSGAAGLVLHAFSDNIVFFMAPSQLKARPPMQGRTIRLGGMVVAGSLHQATDHDKPVAEFEITDGQAGIAVSYQGILPDLFREGQSVVALGRLLPDGHFQADEVLAKHDETYMPKEVADALQKSGKWDPRFGPPPDPARWNDMITHKDNPANLKQGVTE